MCLYKEKSSTRGILNFRVKGIKTKSTRKLSNFNFPWTKTLYQNNLKNIAVLFTFLKGLKLSVVTPKKISHGSLEKMNVTFHKHGDYTGKILKFPVEDVILWNLTFIFSDYH